MALHDKDRIFTNVYGYQPWNLKAAQMRGDWDGTKKLLAMGRDKIVDEIKASNLRGRGGRASRPGSSGASCPRSPIRRAPASW